MNYGIRLVKLLPPILLCAVMILGVLVILPGVNAHGSSPVAPMVDAGVGTSPSIAQGGSIAIACSGVDTCTTGAITNVDAGDALVVVVTEFTTSAGAPSLVEEVTSGGDNDLALLGSTPCITGSGHGVTAIYGLADVTAQPSVTFTVNYPAARYYTIHALDVEGAAASPFETAGTGVCSAAAGTTATASVTTTVAGDLVILGAEVRASTTFAASGGDTLVTQAATTGADLDSGAMLDEIDSATGSISLSATFTSSSWAAIAVALEPGPLVPGTVSPSSATIDAGQSISLTTTPATGGTPPITYQWYTTTSIATCDDGTMIVGATNQSYTTPALSVGTYYYCVWATDNSTPTAQVVYSNVAVVAVNPALTVTITPSAPSIDIGQSVELTANASGGTGADAYAWYLGDSCVGTVLATSLNYTTPALGNSTTYCVAATDSSSEPATATTTATVTVSPTPLTVTITPSGPSIDNGQTVQLKANPSGGTGADSYAWYSGLSCTGPVLATTQVFTTPALSSTMTYCVVVTDSSSIPATANATSTVTVSLMPLTVTVNPDAATIDSGAKLLLTAIPSGGTGALSYAWYLGGSCSGAVLATTQTYTTPALPSTTTYCVEVTDSSTVPASAKANSTVTVSGASGSTTTPPTYVYPVVGALVALLIAAILLGLLRRGRKVSFTETGLPEKAVWSITFKGEAKSSTSATIAFKTSKGESDYAVRDVVGYTATPSTGKVTVNKASVEVKVVFSKRPP